jgi:hypothetical protein
LVGSVLNILRAHHHQGASISCWVCCSTKASPGSAANQWTQPHLCSGLCQLLPQQHLLPSHQALKGWAVLSWSRDMVHHHSNKSEALSMSSSGDSEEESTNGGQRY